MHTPAARAARLVLVGILVAGCATAGPTPAPSGHAAPNATADATSSAMAGSPGESGGTTEATSAPGSTTAAAPVKIPEPLLVGRFTAVAATTGLASVAATPDADATVTTTDETGATWTLTVPAGALVRPLTITMAPLASVDAAGLPGPVTGGVMLEPAGTRFLAPATLTVSGGTTPAKAFILQGDEAGDARLLLPAESAWSTAWIDHFSPETSGDADDPRWQEVFRRLGDLERTEAAALKEAKRLAGEPITIPGIPPTPMTCPDKEKEQASDKAYEAFYDALVAPEMGLIRAVLAAEKARQLAGISNDASLIDLGIKPLVVRLTRKALRVLKDSDGKPELFIPAGRAALSIAKSAQLLGFEDEPMPTLMGSFGPWADKMFDPTIARIKSEHDYQLARGAMEIARTSHLLGGALDLEKVIAKIERALTFEATVTLRLHYPAQEWVVGGDPVTMRYTMLDRATAGQVAGTGKQPYVSYVNQRAPDVTMTGQPFTVQLELAAIDMCKGTATFVVDKFANETETYHIDADFSEDVALAKTGAEASFEKYKLADSDVWPDWNGRFAFPVQLHNKDLYWVNQTVSETAPKSMSKVSADYEIVLKHAPR